MLNLIDRVSPQLLRLGALVVNMSVKTSSEPSLSRHMPCALE